jgi:uncharacterized membrane protein
MKQLFTLLLLACAAIIYFACSREAVPSEEPDPEIIVTPEGDTIYIVNTDTFYITTPPPIVSHPCSPDTVYFEQDLLPIIQSNCALPLCHDNITHKENIYLSTYEQILTTGGIKLNSPTTSKFYTSTATNANERMPPAPAPPLSSQQRALILKWIQQGAQDLHCDPPCDSTAFSYTANIKPIINLHCLGCHTSYNASGNINYSTYAGIKATVDNGKFWASITHAPGVKPMPYPQGSSKLSECDLAKIRKWIEAGAPEN